MPSHPSGSKYQRFVVVEGPSPIFAFASPSGRANRHSAAVANAALTTLIGFLLANLGKAASLDEVAATLFQAVGQAHDAVVKIDTIDPWSVPTTELVLSVIVDIKSDGVPGAGIDSGSTRCLLSVVVGLPQLFLFVSNKFVVHFLHQIVLLRHTHTLSLSLSPLILGFVGAKRRLFST